jgi:hypothetical protein
MVDMVKPIRRAGGMRFKARRQSATQRPISPLDHWIQLFLTEIAPFYETKDTFAIKRVQLVAQYIGLGLRPLFVGRKPVLFLHKFLNLGRGGDKFSFDGLDGRPSLCNLTGKLIFFGIELLNFRMHGRELSLRSFDRPFASDWQRADLFQR